MLPFHPSSLLNRFNTNATLMRQILRFRVHQATADTAAQSKVAPQ
jgi:hypothetical protein